MSITVIKGPCAIKIGHNWVGFASGDHSCRVNRRTRERALLDATKERRIASKETIKSMAETMAVPIGTFKDACAAVGIELPKRPAPVAKNGANGADTTDARLRDLYARVQSLEKQVEQLNPSLL